MKDLKTLFPRASASFIAANEKVLRQIAPDIRAADKAFTPDPPKTKGRTMNATERSFALILQAMQNKGEIVSWQYEGITLRLADNCRFTPDFLVIVSLSPLKIRICEVKGRHVWDDARVKYKVAREHYPWIDWQLWQKTKAEDWKRLL